jgi:hypothetical protein
MHGPINVKSPNNISKWQMGFNSAFKGLTLAKPPALNIKQSGEKLIIQFYLELRSNNFGSVGSISLMSPWRAA